MKRNIAILVLIIFVMVFMLTILGCGESPNDPQVCPQCGGTGTVTVIKKVSKGYEMWEERCDYCFGAGTVSREKADRFEP